MLAPITIHAPPHLFRAGLLHHRGVKRSSIENRRFLRRTKRQQLIYTGLRFTTFWFMFSANANSPLPVECFGCDPASLQPSEYMALGNSAVLSPETDRDAPLKPLLDIVPLLKNANQLRAAGQSKNGFHLLAAEQENFSGTPEYDLLLGELALDSGYADEAVFALQRVVAERPNWFGAQLELARALHARRDYESARRILQKLIEYNPPEQVQRVIQSYLQSLDQKLRNKKTTTSTNFSVTTGYDSNATASTDELLFIGFTLDEASRQQSSSVIAARVEGKFQYVVAPRLKLESNLALTASEYLDAEVSSFHRLRGQLALRYEGAIYSADAELTPEYMELSEGSSLRAMRGMLQFRYAISDSAWVGAAVNHVVKRYDARQNVRDANATSGRLLTRVLLDSRRAPLAQASVEWGEEDATRDGSPYDNHYFRYSSQFSFSLLAAVRAYLSFDYDTADYKNSFFGLKRDDSRRTFGASLAFHNIFDSKWVLLPELTWVDRRSTVTLFDYDRWVGQIRLIREWN